MVGLCFNLWYYLNRHQQIETISVRMYLLDGDEEFQGNLLAELSKHDHRLVCRHSVPQTILSYYGGLPPYSAIKEMGVEEVYKEVFVTLEESLVGDIVFPEEKLFFATPLFDFGGGFVPAEIGYGFIRSRD